LAFLNVQFHPCAEADFEAMATSGIEEQEEAAAQLLWLLDIFRTSLPIYRALLAVNEDVQTTEAESGEFIYLNIKLIRSLAECADDARFQTDAIRRVRQLDTSPSDKYRVFYAMRRNVLNQEICQILGVFPRQRAYDRQTLAELVRRYRS